MGKLNQNFVMFKGDDLPLVFLHVGPFWQRQQQAVTLDAGDGIEWRMHEKDNPGGTVYVTKTRAAGGIEVVSSGYYADNDTIRVLTEEADTTGLAAGEYSHELIVKYGGTDRVVVASGTVTLKEPAG